MEQKTKLEILGKLILSLIFSLFILSFVFRLITSVDREVNKALLFYILRSVSFSLISIYLFFTLLQAFFRAWRYRLFLIASGEKNVPGMFHMYVVTIVRNMFVDIFPIRVGELSYIALLNRGYQVTAHNCVSSLGVSFFFDIVALAFLFFLLVVHHAIKGNMPSVLLYILIAIGIIVLILGASLFFGIKKSLPLFYFFKNKMKQKKIL